MQITLPKTTAAILRLRKFCINSACEQHNACSTHALSESFLEGAQSDIEVRVWKYSKKMAGARGARKVMAKAYPDTWRVEKC